MEEFTDLRVYVSLLIRSWKLILGGTLLAAITAFAASSVMKPTYEATAVIVSTSPRNLVQFDPRFETIESDLSGQPLDAYPEIATSDELLQNLLASLEFSLQDIDTVEDLRKIVEAKSGRDPSLIRLTVRFHNPGQATALVNQWAGLFLARVNELYYDQGGRQVEFFTSQLAASEAELAETDQALIEFEGGNRITTIKNQLNSLNKSQVAHLANQRSARFLIQDVQALRDQLAAQSASTEVTFADQLTALSLQIQAFNAQLSLPLQLQLNDADVLTRRSRDEQIAFLDDLIQSLEALVIESGEQLLELEPQILLLQQEYQQAIVESERLKRDRNVAAETYLSLARKVEEEQITAQDITNGMILASRAVVPQKPVGPRKLVNTALAAVVAGMLAVGVVFAVEWWYADADMVQMTAVRYPANGLARNGKRVEQQKERVLETESGD